MRRVVKGNPPSLESEGVRFPLLVSYAYLRQLKPETFHWCIHEAKKEGFDVLLDCGAFSAANAGHEITLKEYVDFLQEHGDAFFAYLALDKLKDPVQTKKNLDIMYKVGLDPCPVHVLGDTEKTMDELFERASLVFLGGFRRPGRGPARKDYIMKKMQWAKGRDVHWLGYTNQDMLLALKPYSCDSSSWGASQRWGLCDIYLGNGKWHHSRRWSRHERLPVRALAEIQKVGYSLQDWRKDSNWSQKKDELMSMDITTSSWIRYVMDMRRAHGTRIFLASTLIDTDVLKIRKYWAQVRDNWGKKCA